MTGEGFWRWHHPEILGVGCHQELTSSGIGKFVSLEFASNVHCVLGSQIDGVGVAAAVGALNDYALLSKKKGWMEDRVRMGAGLRISSTTSTLIRCYVPLA